MYKYWLHRLSHVIPLLWALHSFHHSAESVTIITGARHHWLSLAVNTAFFPLMAILFTLSPGSVLVVQVIFSIFEGCIHLNYRLSFGRFTVMLNNPQWHRIHHSTKPGHIDKNYAALLPLMDFIFGTAVVPARDEFPPTGMVPSERPDFLEGLLWPLRRWVQLIRARRGVGSVAGGVTPPL